MKKIILLLAFIACISTASANVYGDVNGDGKVTALDSLLVQRASINTIKLDDKQKECAQIYRTEGFGNVDAMVILMYSIGLLKDERDSLYKTRKICDEYNITWGNQNRNN